MSNGYDLSNYVEVSDRLVEFYQKHPGGRVLTSIVELTEKRVVVKAEVYRETAHSFPSGIGHSALAIPGTTPYTRGSELENAETSAVGRALVMAGLSSKKVASADEVRAKRAPESPRDEDGTEIVGLPEVAPQSLQEASTSKETDRVIRFAAEAMGFVATDTANGSGACHKHGRPWKLKEGETNGKPWSFWSCGSRDPEAKKGWCDERPTISWINAQRRG